MGHGVDARQRRDARRLCERQFRIENRGSEGGALVATGHFYVRRCVGNQGVRLCFAAGAGGRRYGDHGHQRAGSFAFAPIILHSTAARVEEVDSLRTVHRAAAADAHDEIGSKIVRGSETVVDMLGRRVLFNAVEQCDSDSILFERWDAARSVSGSDDAAVADN